MDPVKVRCYARSGQRLTFGRLPGGPIIGPEPAELELHPLALKALRGDSRIVFVGEGEGEGDAEGAELAAPSAPEETTPTERPKRKKKREG